MFRPVLYKLSFLTQLYFHLDTADENSCALLKRPGPKFVFLYMLFILKMIKDYPEMKTSVLNI